MDAYDNEQSGEYQDVQANWVVHEWEQIKNNSLGGSVMAYSDEWWKNGLPYHHGTGGSNADTQPDRFLNEEWWGLMWIEDNGNLTDDLYPRRVFHALGNEFYEINLKEGWNLVSFTRLPIYDTNDVNIPLSKGWSVFGYSSPKPFYWYDAMVSDGAETKTIQDAATAGWLQLTIYFYENNSYKFLPGNDDYLRQDKGYWLLAFVDDLTLILPDAGGSSAKNIYKWWDAEVYNGVSAKTLHEAGWLQEVIYCFDANEQYYKFLPEEEPNIQPWRGYWIYSNIDDLILSLPDEDPCNIYELTYDFHLKLHNIIVDAMGIPLVTPDTFNARYKYDDPDVSDVNDKTDVLKSPTSPSGDYVQVYTVHSVQRWMIDNKKQVRKWPIRLFAWDDGFVGLSGTNRLTILNAGEINELPAETIIYLVDHGSTPDGFVAKLDLRDPDNHSYEFPVTNVMSVYRYIDLVIIGCKDTNIDEVNSVNFKDFSLMALNWEKTEPELSGDINWDGKVDFKDLEILAHFWLFDCD